MTTNAYARAAVTAAMGLVLAGAGTRLAGQQPAAASDTATLGAIVVTATRAPTTLGHMPLHTTVISHDEIAKSPAQTIDQLLREVSGLNMSGAPFYTTDPTGQQTRMRGVTNSKVLVMLDGVPIHDPFYSTTQWFKVPLSSVDHIEVVRGGGSSLWGNLAVAGVVNIITKRPVDNGGLVDVSYQSLNTTNAALAKNFVLGGAWALQLSGDILNTNGYQTTPAQYLSSVPGKTASSAINGNARLSAYYDPSANFNAFLRAGYHQQNEDIGGYQLGTNLQKSPDVAAGLSAALGSASRADVKLWAQRVTFNKQNGAACYLASPTACNTTATTSPLVQYANSEDVNPYRELGGSATVSSLVPALRANAQAGLDFRRISGEDSAITYNKPTTTDGASATVNRTAYGQGTQQFVGLFTQMNVFPAGGLQMTVGLRYDYWTNTDGIAEMTRYTNDTAGPTSGGALADSHKGSFNPSLAVRYQFGEGFSLRGAAYRAFRAPGLNNLYRTYSSTTSITIANPHLSPETLTGAELGLDANAGALTLGATGFQYDTKALIASYRIQNAASAPPDVVAICGPTLSNCPASVNFNTNSQDAVSRGLEFSANWRLAPSFQVDGTFTYTATHYTATTTGDPTGVQLGGVPQNLATLGVTWDLSERFRLYGSLRYTDAMYLDVNRTVFQPAFTLFNVSVSYRPMDRLEIYGSGVNLTNNVYSDNPTTSATSETLGLPRSLTGGIRWRF